MDFLQVESTYGGRDHTLKADSVAELTRLINETYERRGKIIMPAFSVGRTQQIVFTLHQLTRDGEDSPASPSLWTVRSA